VRTRDLLALLVVALVVLGLAFDQLVLLWLALIVLVLWIGAAPR
jgi:hypothetical protein